MNEAIEKMDGSSLIEVVRNICCPLQAKAEWQSGGDWGFPNHANIRLDGYKIPLVNIRGGDMRCFYDARHEAKDNCAWALAKLIEGIINGKVTIK